MPKPKPKHPDLAHWPIETIRTTLTQLNILKAKYKTTKQIFFGLCGTVDHDKLLSACFLSWPKFSGSRPYPIKVKTCMVPASEQFALVCQSQCRYLADTPFILAYLALRWNLLEFCQATLRKELAIRQDSAERQLIAEHNWGWESAELQAKYFHYKELLAELEELEKE
jgi:hypothetical protein